MVKDPLYNKILERLEGNLDPDIFESCMGEILRHDIPGLVAVPGGNDAGMDGAIANGEGEPYPLVCTTSERVERNLVKSLDSFRARGRPLHKAALATSRRLTPGRRRKLQDLAKQKGFILVQIFEQRNIAARLYRDGRWRRDLLDLAGAPSALSVVPVTRRPMMDLAPVGREADLRWLREGRGDRVLTGEPGSGKTFLLRHLMLRGWEGLFLTSDDQAAVADALRDQRPRVVVVDDAHVVPHRIAHLTHLREETGARFDILATTWIGARDLVAEHLSGLPEHRIRRLELLTRDEILAVFQAAGVEAHEDILRELVDQASNKPGLAVTIASLCLQGAWREILTGKILSRTLLTTFREIVGENAAAILASFSLGGEAGMEVQVVGEHLGIGPEEIWRKASAMAAGGVLFERGKDQLAVRPRILRSALIREVFFPESGRGLKYRALLERAPHRGRSIEAMVQARLDGVQVPDADLRELVARVGSRHAWAGLAASGEENARWALAEYSKKEADEIAGEAQEAAPRNEITDIAGGALQAAPELVIPILLNLAVEAPGTPEGRPQHPMRILTNWLQELDEYRPEETMRRRRMLARFVRSHLRAGGDLAVGMQAICAILSPRWESNRLDPGAGHTLLLKRAVLNPEQLREIPYLWDSLREALPRLSGQSWRHFARVLWDWIYPEHALRSIDVPEGTRGLMTGFAAKVLQDLVPLAEGNPALVHAMRELGSRAGIALDIAEDPIYEILFPAGLQDGEFESWEADQLSAVHELASGWSNRDPKEVVSQVLNYERVAAELDRTWPRRAPDLCRELASSCPEPETWIDLLIVGGGAADLIRPFLEAAIRFDRPAWVPLLERCLASDRYAWLGIELALREERSPEDILKHALEKVPGAAQLVEALCLRNQVPITRLEALLNHADRKTALAAAIGTWLAEPKENVRDEVLEAWREAVRRSACERQIETSDFGFWLGEILSKTPDLALDWLQAHLRCSTSPFHIFPDKIITKALSGLRSPERAKLLEEVQGLSMPAGFVSSLVNRDEELYRQLLTSSAARPHHLTPLGGPPDERWLPLALAALDHGYSPAEIAAAATGSPGICSGTMSDHWRRLDAAFSLLEHHQRANVREIALEGRELAGREIERWEKKHRERALHG